MSKALESLFSACEELEASDVHVMAGRKPSFRVRGALAPNGDFRELDAALGLSRYPSQLKQRLGVV